MKDASLDHLMQSLGWTLLHSLWQTTLIALCLYLVLAFSHKLSPNIRYVMGVIALLFTGFLATATFLDLYFHHQPALEELQKDIYVRGISAQPFQLTYDQAEQVAEQTVYQQANEMLNLIKTYVNLHLYWIVGVWMAGVLLLSFRFAGSLFYVHRLKKRLVNPVAAKWQAKMQKMAALLQLTPTVRLMTSGVAKVPMMIGHLKPVILIPTSMMSGLPEDQLEAIIAHEMAHIYRKDYWINIIQSLFEIIFFFHPAIWWISSVIREEREKCCDDLAVALCGDSLTYAKALASVEEVKLQHSQLALAVNGGKSSLFQRIERILEPDKSGGNQTARFVSVSLVMIILLVLGSAGDSIAYKYGEQKANEALHWIKTVYLEEKADHPYTFVFDSDPAKQTKAIPEIKNKAGNEISHAYASSTDTVPAPSVVITPVMPNRSYQDSLLRRAVIAASAVALRSPAGSPAVAPLVHPNPIYLHRPDTFPGVDVDIFGLLDSLPDFDFSFEVDSSFIFNLREDYAPHISHNFHFDSIDFNPGAFVFSIDSVMDLRVLRDSLMPALALTDSSLRRLNSYGSAYRYHVQDTSIERRLRELEASMRAKEREFERLMREKEEIIQELMREQEIEMREHEKTFEQQMREQERMLEDQMRQQEEQLRRQEEILERQMEDQAKRMERQEEHLRKEEERLRERESRLDEAHAALEEELLDDGLIKKGETYTFKLSSQGLFINDEKLADHYHQKYLKWMQESETFRFEEGSTLNITRKAE